MAHAFEPLVQCDEAPPTSHVEEGRGSPEPSTKTRGVWKVAVMAAATALIAAVAGTSRARKSAAGERVAQLQEASYGQEACRCIAIDQLEGNVTVSSGDATFNYPADVGARCESWDETSDPACSESDPPSYCSQKWCYVDPCNCDGLSVPPKASSYFSDATFQGRPLLYSYVTCGGEDEWSSDEAKTAAQERDNEELCSETADATVYGDAKCPCIGVDGREGEAVVTYNNSTMVFPVDVGSRCHPWELEDDPACQSDSAPSYCEKAWCYVDPCNCDLDVPSKPSSYLPDATHLGRTIGFSYATCGEEDHWSKADQAQAAETEQEC